MIPIPFVLYGPFLFFLFCQFFFLPMAGYLVYLTVVGKAYIYGLLELIKLSMSNDSDFQQLNLISSIWRGLV